MSERFIDTLIKRAHEETEGITFLDPAGETTLTYGALCRTAQEWAGSLMNRGVRQGSHVVLQIVDNKALVPAFWAAIIGKQVSGLSPANGIARTACTSCADQDVDVDDGNNAVEEIEPFPDSSSCIPGH